MRGIITKISSLILVAIFGLYFQANLQAAGFALIEMNASGQGNAYAGAAVGTNDASTIFFNPAGMMNFDGDQLVLVGHYISPSADFNNDGSSLAEIYGTAFPAPTNGTVLAGDDDDGGSSAFVPNLYWTKALSEDMKFGLGFNSPFGLKTEYGDDWVGRYHAVESDLKTININPSLAYRVNSKVVVGGGLNVMLADVVLSNAVDLGSVCVAGLAGAIGPVAALGACEASGAAPQEFDGFADLSGDNFDDLGYGFNLGLTFAASQQTRIGVHYRSEVEINVEGEADFTVPGGSGALNTVIAGSVVNGDGLFADSDLEASIDLPAQLSFSVAHTVGKYTWLFDVTRTFWNSFEELRIEYDNADQPDSVTTFDWEDSNRYSVGLDYQYSDKLILRTGIALDETPIPSAEARSPRLPGDDRTWISFGLAYLINPQMTLDLGYSHLFVDDADIDNEFESTNPALLHTLTGEYEAEVDILSAQLTWKLK